MSFDRSHGHVAAGAGPLDDPQTYTRSRPGGQSTWIVIALLFADPTSTAMRDVAERGDYFDVRTGETWDLFFPGYYQSNEPEIESSYEARRLMGSGPTANWYFSARDFNRMREHVEEASEGRWEYSGDADLVLINAILPPPPDGPTIDWNSVQSGTLSNVRDGAGSTTNLADAVERISRDLEKQLEDPAYGVHSLMHPAKPTPGDSTAKKVMIGALGGIAAAAAKAKLGW